MSTMLSQWLLSAPEINLQLLQELFEGLPLDSYTLRGYRLRRHSTFENTEGGFVILPQQPFLQSSLYNHLLGGVDRIYEPLETRLLGSKVFHELLKNFEASTNRPLSKIGVHQIRTLCEGSIPGLPTPEGLHRDGFDVIGIYCVARKNIEGGLTSLYQNEHSLPILRWQLQPGELLVIDDRRLLHYTSPLLAANCHMGWRDVFVLTGTLKSALV